MKKYGVLLLTLVLGATLSFAQTTKKTDQKATTTKTEKSEPKVAPKADTKPGGAFDKGEKAPTDKIDVNSASQDDLEKLSGIGPVTAKKIVDGRPYKTKRELLTKKVVSASEYDKIKDHIIAHQDATTAKADTKATTTKKK